MTSLLEAPEAPQVAHPRAPYPAPAVGRLTPLATARRTAKLSLTGLARAVHVSRATVALWDSGRRRPGRQYWPALASALGMHLDDVVGLLPDYPPARLDGQPLPSLAVVRAAAGLSQRALADLIGVAPTTVSMWETARVRVPAGTAGELARLLDTEVARLAAQTPPSRGIDPRPLRRIRRRLGMSQREAAAHLGVAVGTLARYESGERATPVPVIRRMAVIYRCPAVEILTVAGPPLLPIPPLPTWRSDDVPQIIRAARTASGLTRVALGRAVDRSERSVHAWEAARTRPGEVSCRRLEAVLGLPAGRLVAAAHPDRPPGPS